MNLEYLEIEKPLIKLFVRSEKTEARAALKEDMQHAARFIFCDFRSRTLGFVSGLLRKEDLPPLQSP